jgi:plastocyanin
LQQERSTAFISDFNDTVFAANRNTIDRLPSTLEVPTIVCYNSKLSGIPQMKRLLVACALVLGAASAPAAVVAGKVNFVAKRGQNPNAAETLVWLEPTSSVRLARRAPMTVQMVTRSKTLLPHVMAIPVGSTVDFPNDDPISHNLFSLSSSSPFDLGLYRKGAGKSHHFDNPGIVNVYCNVHPAMSAVIHVMATPYYGFADGTGAFALSDVASGQYRLVAWNEQSGRIETPVEVTSRGQVSGATQLILDSRNYREMQHTNKNGQAYQPTRSRDY